MRRRVQQILCGVLIAGTVLASQPLPVFAETDTETGSDVSETDVKENSDYVIYVNKDNPDTASIVEYTGSETEVKIPEYIDGKKITRIFYGAFENCANITSLELPDSIETLQTCLFGEDNESLVSLKLPAKEIIVDGSFEKPGAGCYPPDDDHIFSSAGPFGGCKKLKNVEIPKGWTKVPAHLFDGCSGLENVGIPDTVTELGEDAFAYCNISTVGIPDSVKTIDYECFAKCPLKSVYGGKNLQSIHEYYLGTSYCGKLPQPTFGDGKSTFYGYRGSNLEEWSEVKDYSFVDIGKCDKDHEDYEIAVNQEVPGTASIVKYKGNKSELKIPAYIDGKIITEIGEAAFHKCDSIVSLEIPDSIDKLGTGAFASCSSLVSVKFPGKNLKFDCMPLYLSEDESPWEPWNSYIYLSTFSNCANLKKIEIAEGATEFDFRIIGSGCTAVRDVVIPRSVTEIESMGGIQTFSERTLCVHGYTGSYAEEWEKKHVNYNGGMEAIDKTDTTAKICSRNLSLEGKIGASAYVQVPEELLEYGDAYATIRVNSYDYDNSEEVVRSTKVLLRDLSCMEVKGKKVLIIDTHVKPYDLSSTISVSLHYSDGSAIPVTDEKGNLVKDAYRFSVADTARTYMNAKSSSKKLKNLTKAVVNYGIYVEKMQDYIWYSSRYDEYDYNNDENYSPTDNLSDIKKAALKDYAVKKSGKVNGVSYAGVNLELKKETGLVVYFKATTDPANLTFTVDGKKVDVVTNDLEKGKLITVKIDGISAQKLSTEREIVVSDGEKDMSVKLSALSWSRNVLYGSGHNKVYVDMAKMLYRYSSAADEYFGK